MIRSPWAVWYQSPWCGVMECVHWDIDITERLKHVWKHMHICRPQNGGHRLKTVLHHETGPDAKCDGKDLKCTLPSTRPYGWYCHTTQQHHLYGDYLHSIDHVYMSPCVYATCLQALQRFKVLVWLLLHHVMGCNRAADPGRGNHWKHPQLWWLNYELQLYKKVFYYNLRWPKTPPCQWWALTCKISFLVRSRWNGCGESWTIA